MKYLGYLISTPWIIIAIIGTIIGFSWIFFFMPLVFVIYSIINGTYLYIIVSLIIFLFPLLLIPIIKISDYYEKNYNIDLVEIGMTSVTLLIFIGFIIGAICLRFLGGSFL